MSHKTLFLASMFAGIAFSTQGFTVEEKYDHQECWVATTHVIQHADGFLAGSFDTVIMIHGPENDPFYLMSGHCVGTFRVIDGQGEEYSSCDYANAAGDKIFNVAVRKGGNPATDEGTTRVVHGTGKFAGMNSEGKWKPSGTFPPAPGASNMANGCVHGWGTYTLK
jgi:hypothetical protein